MDELNEKGVYSISSESKAFLSDFYGNYATEAETAEEIKRVYDKTGYIMDTHTAVASCVYGKYKKDTNDDKVNCYCKYSKPIQIYKKCYECN